MNTLQGQDTFYNYHDFQFKSRFKKLCPKLLCLIKRVKIFLAYSKGLKFNMNAKLRYTKRYTKNGVQNDKM